MVKERMHITSLDLFSMFFLRFKLSIRVGSVPKINPIKIEFVCIGYVSKKYCKKLLKIIIPNTIPINKGSKK